MPLLDVQALTFYYDQRILDHLDFSISRGEFVALLGVNGSGKSTLLNTISRFLKPAEGHIYIGGEDLHTIKARLLAQHLAYVTQYNLPVQNTVYDVILTGRIPHMGGNPQHADHERVENIIVALEMESYALRQANTLSGGQFQKVVIARALAQEPRLILLDEPTSSLDIKNQLQVVRMLKKYCAEKHIAVFASMHDINLALHFSDKFLLLKGGRIYAYGDASILTASSIKEVYGIEVAVLPYRDKKVIAFC
ncbi:MAG: ABC transporter ATP-binding protein [Negativicutes bacterium]|jgi:ferrichrome ABC transporter, ATP-binding protein FhuC